MDSEGEIDKMAVKLANDRGSSLSVLHSRYESERRLEGNLSIICSKIPYQKPVRISSMIETIKTILE
jgi:hypothetical protein